MAISRERPSPDAGVDRKLERKPSLPYGHHRNTSIVHGVQHSRNTSFVNSPATSPLSPQIIAAAGGAGSNGLDGPFMMPQDELADLPANISPAASSSGGRYGTGPPSVSGDYRAYSEQYRGEPRRLERTDSVRMKHTHVRSQSKHHHGRTVGELALHHLFNAVGALSTFRGGVFADDPGSLLDRRIRKSTSALLTYREQSPKSKPYAVPVSILPSTN